MAEVSRKASVLAGAASVYAVLAVSAVFAAPEFDRGRELYENHCKECHESWVHTRDGSRINSYSDIRRWVTTWAVHKKLGWNNDEIDDVIDFLNREFYHLTDKP